MAGVVVESVPLNIPDGKHVLLLRSDTLNSNGNDCNAKADCVGHQVGRHHRQRRRGEQNTHNRVGVDHEMALNGNRKQKHANGAGNRNQDCLASGDVLQQHRRVEHEDERNDVAGK